MRIASVLTALLGAAVLLQSTMTGHDKYREKLITAPRQPVAGSVQVSAASAPTVRDAQLLLELKIASPRKTGRTIVVWNGHELSRLRSSGRHFIKIPSDLFRPEGNALSLQGLAAGSSVSVLEIKNLYGFSTGLLESVMVIPGSRSVKRLPWPLAALLAVLLLTLSWWKPKTASLAAGNVWLRLAAWTILVLFLVILAGPIVVSVRVFLGAKTALLLIAILYLPGILIFLRQAAKGFCSRLLPRLRTLPPLPVLSPGTWKVLGAVALAAIFIFFAAHRQRYVGASDWYGYYAESLMFRQGRLTMAMTYPPARYPAFAPLGFNPVGNRVIPQYPPGFPLLLALFGFIGLEFYVNALAGALTILLLYLILRDSVSRGLAFCYTLLWTFFPVTVYISVRIMSDLVATAFILLSYYLFSRNRIFWSGVAFSYAVAVRPSCVLFFVVFLPLLLKKKKFWPFVFSSAILGSLYGLYNWTVFGKPWRTGYGLFAHELTGSVFWHHFAYYGKTMFLLLTPLLLIPALWSLARRKPRSLFLFSWATAFWVFYSFWLAGADSWWYLRFLLPGLPGLFILSAIGTQDLGDRLHTWKPRWRPWLNGAALALLLGLLAYYHVFSHKNWVYSADKGEMYYRASRIAERLLPANALVGGIETSGPLRLYTRLESFRWDLQESTKLINDFLALNRPIFFFVEPWNARHPALDDIAEEFKVEHVAWMPGPIRLHLVRVRPRD